ncbi:hypothetical protein EYC80_001128 [Monilinia laxa]|uniref:Uncharacterized protein n=1 Tax=Monilinia laxa TaxID=61186 RepID=A0A5N6K957_MONLA|nr:hypothetical protein EYC80_001128 [Monilinia laxa]
MITIMLIITHTHTHTHTHAHTQIQIQIHPSKKKKTSPHPRKKNKDSKLFNPEDAQCPILFIFPCPSFPSLRSIHKGCGGGGS